MSTAQLEHLDPPTLARALAIIDRAGIITPRRLGYALWRRHDRAPRATRVARRLRREGLVHFVQEGPGRTGWAVTRSMP